MTASSKVSACVDCATPIIGDLFRCPMCRDAHDAQASITPAAASIPSPLPRERVRVQNRTRRDVERWIAVIEILGIVGIFLVFFVKGCAE